MSFQSLDEIVNKCEGEKISFYEAVLKEDMENSDCTEDESLRKMQTMWEAMKAADATYDENLLSKSGLTGGDGARMERYRQAGDTYCGDFMTEVISAAVRMAESNACMKRIVAAPTAGACGVLPAVLITFQKRNAIEDEVFVQALYVAAGIGEVIATRAFIAGAAGGCQAEIGAASAMAAGALTFIKNGDARAIAHSCAMALKNLLGLVCDPVAGLVEVPCVKRNVVGAMNALSCADMALAGIRSKIPPDQVIDAMREVGESMDVKLKETGAGGVAASLEGKMIAHKLKEK
ncbi:MAG: L-serine ammonia-lyase, iron-sulfur-dependent, subunit alpha [Lachnospiraceae bacterium]|jgi:L-serine dehydratase|nr:L-serine ammonia-lyase, iron-sulfur-dependent, subunit alpha [Lachnospiraceae bacterium]MDD3616167.1 L-serine ammonia-lyase, iron-sulfur-dependent, subunit alpha [Lachnospiraceae bacterium]